MGKLRTGPCTYLIKCSNGADNNQLNFYSTSYSSFYGKEDFQPTSPKPKGTGYLANSRPGLYYSRTIDNFDAEKVGALLQDNYETSYYRQYKPYSVGSNGNDQLPMRIIRNESGFTQKNPITTAHSKLVEKTREETMDDRKYKPLLHKLQGKRIPHLDAGSMDLTTEARVCYKGEQIRRMNTHLKDVGTMQPSGFTHHHHVDPVQYLPKAAYGGEKNNRPTDISQHQEKFLNWPTLKGSERNQGICKRAQRDNGYNYETARPRFVERVPESSFTTVHQVPPPVARRIQKQDPCEYVNMTNGLNHETLSKIWFKAERQPRDGAHERRIVGRKETSGYCTNNGRYVEMKDDKNRFATHYGMKFGKIPQKVQYQGSADPRDCKKPTNGFTKSTVVQSFGDGKVFREHNFEAFHPLVSKVIKKENPCYVDNTKNLKLRVK
ncbi:stabilizer of axonemal microtubules 4-like [Clavelina lepadiformis]|uniref:stabilizer of axonemal microtubules 4-like n=1 Tax=Clavelina lepadiformis TaxID=159417 RepID=UPI00404142BF